MNFWLRLGVDGFRLDAAPHMVERKGLESTEPDDPHGIIRNFRRFVSKRKGDAVLLGEVDTEPSELGKFFGDGDELQLLYNFLLDNYLFLAFAREDVEPIVEVLRLLPPTPPDGQWVNFLRNLDELDLERLLDPELEDAFESLAPDEDMRIYGRGIRRRLAPMLDGDQRRIRLAFSLLFSLPGTPMVTYGDEIGMGDDLSLEGRTAVRTPMQWSGERNAGFSTASTDDVILPVIDDGEFSYERVNVADQRIDPDSIFNHVQRLIHTRKEPPEIGWGPLDVIETEKPGVLVHRCKSEDNMVVTVHNLADEETTVSFELEDNPPLFDIFGNERYEPLDCGTYEFDITPYGYRWLRVRTALSSRSSEWDYFE